MQNSNGLSKVINLYTNKRDKIYDPYTEKLKLILTKVSKKHSPFIDVEARTKSIESFTEKILRKNKYTDPLKDITDICGIRIITSTLDEREILCKYIEDNFTIDWNNSLDVSQRLKPSEFGYKSIHYIVQPKQKYSNIILLEGEDISRFKDIKAEIQIRTLAEHLFAEYTHEVVKIYKAPYDIPKKWIRELANIAAMLENIDDSLMKIKVGINAYTANYQDSLEIDKVRDELRILHNVLSENKDLSKNVDIASRIGKHAKSIHDWDLIINVLEDYSEFKNPEILKYLGIAYVKKYSDNTSSEEYNIGQKHLMAAMNLYSVKDVETILAYAESLEKTCPNKAKECYYSAYKKDITNPLSVVKYIMYEISSKTVVNTKFIQYLIYSIDGAIERCLEKISLKMNVPWSYYNLAALYLFKCVMYKDTSMVEKENHYYELAFSSYAKAIYKSKDPWIITEQSQVIGTLLKLDEENSKLSFLQKFLELGCEFKVISNNKLFSSMKNKKQIIIVVGSCNNAEKQWLDKNKQIIIDSFSEFEGIIISGGTESGICGVVGEIEQKYKDSLETFGYVPKGKSDLIDKRYRHIKRTTFDDFSEFEAIHYWEDLLKNSINPKQIRVLGVDGGTISFFEYQMALAFGVNVAICGEVDGNKIDSLFSDNGWLEVQEPAIDISNDLDFDKINLNLPLPKGMLIKLPTDEMTIREFIEGTNYSEIDEINENLQKIAMSFHDDYCKNDFGRNQITTGFLSLQKWDDLRDDLKYSNLALAKHTMKKLNRLNCAIVKVKECSSDNNFKFTDDEIEKLAQMEHARWNVERLLQGWRYGNKDVENKMSPFILPWSELTVEAKNYDLEIGRTIVKVLDNSDLSIIRK